MEKRVVAVVLGLCVAGVVLQESGLNLRCDLVGWIVQVLVLLVCITGCWVWLEHWEWFARL